MRIDRVVRVLPEGCSGVNRLACVRKRRLAGTGHHISRETIHRSRVAGIRRVGVGGRHHRPAELAADERLRTPSHRERVGCHIAVDLPAFIIVDAAHVHAHEVIVVRRSDQRHGCEVLRGGRGHRCGVQDKLRAAIDLCDRRVVAHAETDDGHAHREPGRACAIHRRAAERRRATGEIHTGRQSQIPAAIRHQRRGIHEGHDVGSRDWLRIVTAGAVTTNAADLRLPVHLSAEIHHRPAEARHGVGRLRRAVGVRRVHRRRADGVVVVAPAVAYVMASIGIERLPSATIRLGIAIDGVAVERPCQRLVIAQRSAEARGEMRRDDVIMIIIRQAAMPAVVVEFADLIRHTTRVVGRIENGDAVGCDCDRTTLEVVVCRARRENQRWRCCDRRHERQTPVVRLLVAEGSRCVLGVRRAREIGHRQRHLLLPRRDARHAVRHPVRHVVALDEERRSIPVEADLRLERRERRRHERAIADGWHK